MPSKLLVAGVAGHYGKVLPDFMKTFIIKLSMRKQDLDIDVLAREGGGRTTKRKKKKHLHSWISMAVVPEMKRILRWLAKLRVPPGIQQLDIPGLCLDGPSVEIVGFSLDCVYI